MKNWILLIALGATVVMAEEPSLEVVLPETPGNEVFAVPALPDAPASTLPGAKPVAPGNPAAPATEMEIALQEAIDSALGEPPSGAPGRLATAPATGPATTSSVTTSIGGPMESGVATSNPATQPSTVALATTRFTTNPTTTTASTQPGFTRDRFARATPPPRSIAAAKVMPKEFAMLVSRSVFVHGRMPVDSPPRERSNEGPPIPMARPEKSLLFNGATNSDGQLIALIEDTAAGRILKLKVGDPVARGKVAGITLDTFDYDSAGKVQRVVLGQNLDGEASSATTRPTTATATTGPSGEPAPLSTGGGPLADIMERMRLKRALEMGGK